jgi:hypothetical protein
MGHEYRAVVERQGEPSLEFAAWADAGDGAVLSGTVVAWQAGPLKVEYRIETRGNGTARRVDVAVKTAATTRTITLTANGFGHWFMQGVPVPALTGCLDVGLWVSPVPHLLPIRRLHLEYGAGQRLPLAWVSGPDLVLLTVHYRYEHVLGQADGHRYRITDEENAVEEGVWLAPDGFLNAAGPYRRLR